MALKGVAEPSANDEAPPSCLTCTAPGVLSMRAKSKGENKQWVCQYNRVGITADEC